MDLADSAIPVREVADRRPEATAVASRDVDLAEP